MGNIDLLRQTPWVQFERDTGRIVQYGSVPYRDLKHQSSEALGIIVGTATFDDYVVENVVVPRPLPRVTKSEIVADDSDAAVIENLPDVCKVIIDGTEYTIEGGRLEITSPMPATYRVFVPEQFPWRELAVEIVAK